ncbi:hypothetical protein HMPREF3226_00158 [Prevotella corporis]|uniref:Uncharacterized protein n=1 Tax=Prevotella corporis TaxID=28128 RepID=A0A133QMY9_9BACT|nr:hypothetical protein HMPREF3226_00158 [Prevotella corporis]
MNPNNSFAKADFGRLHALQRQSSQDNAKSDIPYKKHKITLCLQIIY